MVMVIKQWEYMGIQPFELFKYDMLAGWWSSPVTVAAGKVPDLFRQKNATNIAIDARTHTCTYPNLQDILVQTESDR